MFSLFEFSKAIKKVFIVLSMGIFIMLLMEYEVGAYLVTSLLGLGISIIIELCTGYGNKNSLYRIIALIATILIMVIVVMLAMYVYTSAQKPIIYLYPESTTEVNVSLGNPELLTCSYPKYNEKTGWSVIADPTGNLEYMVDGGQARNLYALYWEGKSKNNKCIHDDGFIVKGEDTAYFLEEKLGILGLNERETEEFIVYWLPQMESNKYNYIRFESMEEIDENMPLNITPRPDTTIRVMMDWCSISSERKANKLKERISEQELTTPVRTGFVAVEWGGSIINNH